MTQRLLIIIGLLCLVSLAQAQDSSIVSADDIFADGVTVLERLPAIEFDRLNRHLYYFDPDTMVWSSFPYPDEATDFNRYQERNDGKYLIQRISANYDINHATSSYDDEWLFDPQTGIFSRDNLTCGRITATLADGEWFVHQLDTGIYILCNTATGQEIPLAFDIQSDLYCGNLPETSSQSPDGLWVVFHNCGEPLKIYSANTSTGETYRLGESSDRGFPYWEWLRDDILELTFVYWGFSPRFNSSYVIKTNLLGSLIHVGYNTDIRSRRESIVWFEQNTLDEGNFQNRIYLLDISSYQQEVIFEETCRTSNAEACLSGGQVAISPSQRYLAIGSALYPREWGQNRGNYNFIVIDRETTEYVYENSEFSWFMSDMRWIDDNTLVFVDEEETRTNILQLELNTGQMQNLASASRNIGMSISPHNDVMLLPTEAHNYRSILYFPTGESFDIFQPEVFGYIWWTDFEDELIFYTRVMNGCDDRPCTSNWHIQIDAISETDT